MPLFRTLRALWNLPSRVTALEEKVRRNEKMIRKCQTILAEDGETIASLLTANIDRLKTEVGSATSVLDRFLAEDLSRALMEREINEKIAALDRDEDELEN